MRIGDRDISHDSGPYIIAEIGVNHDGDGDRALMLVERAREAGADGVKFQYFQTDLLMSSAAKLAAYQKSAGETDPIAMLRRLELSERHLERCVDRAHALGIDAIVTVFSVGLVERATAMGWDAYKSASPDIIHRPLLEAMADTGLPLIVSTGASLPDEITRARAWIDHCADRLAFLQCVSSYPCPPEEAALDAIGALRALTACPVGYSDHTPCIETGALAVQHGALILEKHFTDDRSAQGPDHAASLEPEQLTQYIRMAREAAPDPQAPVGAKMLLDRERDVRHVSRQSIVWTRAMHTGEVVLPGDVTCKRPGIGIEPWRLHETIGRRIARPVVADVPAQPEDLED